MVIAVQAVLAIVLVVPVVQIEIVKHGAFDECRHIRVKVKLPVEPIAEPRDAVTVVEGADLAVLLEFFHLLNALVGLKVIQYFVHFLFVCH